MKIKAEKRHLIHPPQGRVFEPRWGHRSDGMCGDPPRRCVPQATGAPVIDWGLTLQCLESISKRDHTQQPIRCDFAFLTPVPAKPRFEANNSLPSRMVGRWSG